MNCPECGWGLKELRHTSYVLGSIITYHLVCKDCNVYITVNMDKLKYDERCLKYNKKPLYEIIKS
jgi:hypothetical protein